MNSKYNNKSKDLGQSVFEQIVTSFSGEAAAGMHLQSCMSFNPELTRKVPIRYRLIAFAFARGMSLDDLNELLKSQGCAGLYSRSIWEASLIYAFLNKMSYDEWKELQPLCEEMRAVKETMSGFFSEGRVSLKDIRDYLNANSDVEESSMNTRHLTRAMDEKLRRIAMGKGTFREFLEQNLESMASVREKARYYFCKYLYYYLISCRDRYLAARAEGANEEEAMAELAVFKGLTKLKRTKMSDEEVISLLDTSGVSFGEIFDAFNYYFFDYVSLDWMEVQLDYYGNIESMSEEDREELAASLRKYSPDLYKGLPDDEVLRMKQEEIERKEESLDDVFSREGENKGYQRNRAGENTLRKYVKGSLDIDRITLVCLLIFFGSKSNLPDELRITQERLDTILAECGFAGLREEDDFDYFIMEYLEAEDPVDYLMDIVTYYALDEENFFLYRMYQASRSAEEDLLKLTA